ncbi:MAG: ankyrin repeat domain-containing protein [Vicinamibacterales bacterium]
MCGIAVLALVVGLAGTALGQDSGGTRPDGVDAIGTTPLHRAAEAGDTDEVTRLLAAGADVHALTRYHVSPLALAVVEGHADVARALLSAGADPNSRLGEGEPVLLTAARVGRVDVIRALLEAGADVNGRERFYGQSAVMWAAIEDHAEVIALLAGAGADVDARADVLEGEPLWRYGRDRRNGINGEALQNFNTNFSKGGLTALMYAARSGATRAALALVEKGADIAAVDPEGFSALHLAIMNGFYDTAAALVKAGADVNQEVDDNSGQTPLFALVDHRSLLWVYNRPTPRPESSVTSLELATALLDAGAKVDARLLRGARRPMGGGGSSLTGEGATAFLRAAVASDLPMMRLLLERGADPTVTTKRGVNALHAAAGLDWVDNTMSTAVALGFATEEDSIEAITLLLDRGLDVNAADEAGSTALHGAAFRGANAVIRFLAMRGARLDAKTLPKRIPGNVNDRREYVEPERTPIDLALMANPPRVSTVALLRELMGEDPGAPLPELEGPKPAN